MFRKIAKDMNKIYHSFARIPYNSYFRKCIKRWSQWFQGKHIVVSHFSKFWCCKATLPENTPSRFVFFWSLANFLRIGIKNNSRWIAQNILSKEVKQVVQRRGRGCNGIAKESKAKHLPNFTVDIFTLFRVSFDLMVFRWIGIRSGGC